MRTSCSASRRVRRTRIRAFSACRAAARRRGCPRSPWWSGWGTTSRISRHSRRRCGRILPHSENSANDISFFRIRCTDRGSTCTEVAMQPMRYPFTAVPDERIPRASDPAYQHMLDTYVSETNKVASVWREFGDEDLAFRPHPRSSTVGDIVKHQLLSERRFFGEFIGTPEPAPGDVLPAALTIASAVDRVAELARARLAHLAPKRSEWWLARVPFFDVERERIWVFWRRVLHTAHHRTQLTVYLRMLDRAVPSTYGPTADVTWTGADPTQSVDAAGRR